MSNVSFSEIFPVRGSDLRHLRNLGGLTTMQMAQAAGVKTRKTYENWEKDMSTPNVNQFFSMLRACGFDTDNIDFFHTMKEHRRRAAKQLRGPDGKKVSAKS